MRSARCAVRSAVLMLLVATPLGGRAQDTTSTRRVPALSWDDLAYAGGVAVATLAISPLDKTLADFLQSHGQADRRLRRLSHTVETIAVPGALIIGGGLYLGGRLADNDKMADLGLHGTEAVVIGQALVTVLKVTTGRARPYVSRDRPHDFEFGRGLRHEDYRSFPSGHSVTAFAAAAAVTEETRRWWPGSVWYIAPVMYGGATLVGVSRMYNNKHWASDVLVGGAIGVFTGRRVVRWHHSHPGNRLDRWLLGISIAPDPGGGGHTLRLIAVPSHVWRGR
jgi:membrane-associated phospholipid phosphatase